ncbi:glycosyltransferase [Sphingomonas rubra]|uniref:Dolichol-phosphate mannosyltransferase n=1 Tax=Sphingomonas rubra TaxID=634430 RepID=A0A1I5QML1_9SPHN|nr:glycosyltransferase [Sphingomonas rubra]SFP47499.1 dolichol-phosphate mannosyltransferase [Sphingomonas rubra]
MGDVAWELIVVDDDSPDGTAAEVTALRAEGWPVRVIRRVGRRGLASAVVEGALAAEADHVAVIDADMQHDERLLPRMLALMEADEADLVIGSRYLGEGGIGDWDAGRARISRVATRCATLVIGAGVSDPMSGFFAIKRDAFHACVYDLSQQGYKILLDVLTSSPRRLVVVELPYVFRSRQHGESKLDVMVAAELLFLLIEKLSRGFVPPRFVLFCAVGGVGLAAHLLVLGLLSAGGAAFIPAQTASAFAAMTLNFAINNAVTYRAQRLRGARFVVGYAVFCLICSIGGLANIGVADLVLVGSGSWPLAGIAGALMSAVFNFGAASQLVWNGRRRSRRPLVRHG